jgi:cell division inhibitor SepF
VVPPALEAERERGPVVRPLTINTTRTVEGEDDVDRIQTRPMVVRPADQPAVAKPQILSPTSFAAAQEVADRFKATRPVIMNLQGLDRDIARRLIDFASGLCYGLGGHMEKVANHVFLLTPADVKVPEEERRRITERGLYES